MRAAVTFEGAVGGKLRTFRKGDPITKEQAEEMNLADKPGLATSKKEARKDGAKA
ncbi:hypothetical protein [Oceaniglobus ichthyenteri]|uniref:hypothetical protein n=1 Tax=Oceaniglobus ichthyenteri TaxID=2136177 RepID=UPI0013DDD5BF|nr:hypothetical protein [Oceaniglobus ichthyenteri]